MRYVALVHKEPGSAFGVIIPDVPGCFSAGDDLDEALRNAGEALSFHLEGEAHPPARTAEAVLADPAVADLLPGALVATVSPQADGNVALDETLARRLDEAAERHGVSRTEFVDRTLRRALEEN